jgi:hypothetical protein
MDSTLVFAALGLALHVLVGVIAGRVLVRLTEPSAHDPAKPASKWGAYVFGLLVMIGYGFAAGHLANALRDQDVILIAFAVIMLTTCLVTYLRR